MRGWIRRRGLRFVGAAALSGVIAATVLALLPTTSSAPERSGAAGSPAAGVAGRSLPDPVEPAFTPGKPRLLGKEPHIARWAPVRFSVPAREQPHAGAPVIARLGAWTPEGTQNIVLVLGTAIDASDDLWVHVRLPVLPNNTTGWVPRASLGGYSTVRTHLVVDLDELTATLLRDGRPIFRAPVGVGEEQWPTPTGEFYVRNRLTSLSSFYGPLAFGTSARSPILTDWPAGGFVGIHGTNRPELLPGRVSHGCVRLRNEDILRLDRLMPVGTPVTIR